MYKPTRFFGTTSKYVQVVNKDLKIGELLADDSFIRWIEGTASSAEATNWNSWKADGPNRNKLIEEALALHGQLRFEVRQREDIDQELIKLNQVLDSRDENRVKTNRVVHSLNRSKSRRSAVWSAAAVLIVSMMISGLVYFLVSGSVQEINSEIADARTQTVETGFGETRSISFTDGSVIMLHANSVVTYSIYSSGVMDIELDGEAWFDISPSSSRRVSVHTLDGSVHVLGTTFNVSTYGEGTAVVLEQGSVQVEMKNRYGEIGDDVTLSPGTMARMTAGDSAIYTEDVDPVLYTSWTQNRLRFDETPFTVLEKRIKDIYGLEFMLADGADTLRDIRISGSVPNDNIEVLLNALEGLLDRSATIQGTEIVLHEK